MKEDVTVRVPVVRLFPDGKRPALKTKPLGQAAAGDEGQRRRRPDETTRKFTRR